MPILGWLALLGWVGFSVESIIAIVRRQEGSFSNMAKIPLLLSGYFWFGFSFLESESRADLVVWLMHLTFGFGWLMGSIMRLSKKAMVRLRMAAPQRYLQPLIILIITPLVILYAGQTMPAKTGQEELMAQGIWAAALHHELGSEGRIQSFGHLLPLVLTRRVNLTPMIHLGPKHYNLAMHESGGFDRILGPYPRYYPRAASRDGANIQESLPPLGSSSYSVP